MKNKHIYIPAILLLLLSFASCSLKDNINPNYPEMKKLSPRQRMAAAQVETYAVQGSSMNELGNVFMNAYAGNIYYFGNPAVKESNLAIDNSFYGSIWNSTYLGVAQLQGIIESEQDLFYHKAIAKILKAHYMQYIVDLYNDIPYSEAFKRGENISPKYDNSLDVYKALVGEINDALKLIEENPENDDIAVKSNEDVIMGGDMSKWIKFANTVKLRYLVRMSKTTNSDAISFRDEQLKTLQGKEFIDFDVTINPGYNASSSASQNPIYNALGYFTYSGSRNTYGHRLYKASAHIAAALNGDADAVSAGVVDPRSGDLFVRIKSSGKVSGIEQGAKKDVNFKESNFSHIGGFLYSYASKGSEHDGYLMLASESYFLQAEVAIEFPSVFSDAETALKNGIKASFAFYEKEDEADDYISGIDALDGCGWSGSADKLSPIQYQKWIALTNIHAMETYLGYLKTGYPETPLALTAQKPHKPYRLIYPASEYSANASNVPQMGTDDAFEKNDFTPFWLK